MYKRGGCCTIITSNGKSFPILLLLSVRIFGMPFSFLSWLQLETFFFEAGALRVWLKPPQKMYCIHSERWHLSCYTEPLQCLGLPLPCMV